MSHWASVWELVVCIQRDAAISQPRARAHGCASTGGRGTTHTSVSTDTRRPLPHYGVSIVSRHTQSRGPLSRHGNGVDAEALGPSRQIKGYYVVPWMFTESLTFFRGCWLLSKVWTASALGRLPCFTACTRWGPLHKATPTIVCGGSGSGLLVLPMLSQAGECCV